MNNFIIFAVGLVVTLITGMGVITSQVFIAYSNKFDSNNLNINTSNNLLDIQNNQ